MKKVYLILFILLLVFKANTGFCTKHTVSAGNFDYVFSPADINVYVGDTIVFSLGIYHSALEVSQSTWNADGNTALSGGFHVGFGGGETVVNTAKTYYYVCENHYSMGMKGAIVVTDPTGVNMLATETSALEVFPNPTSSGATIKTRLLPGREAQIKVFDGAGRCVYEKVNIASTQYLDLSSFSAGVYSVTIKQDDVFLEKKVIVSR